MEIEQNEHNLSHNENANSLSCDVSNNTGLQPTPLFKTVSYKKPEQNRNNANQKNSTNESKNTKPPPIQVKIGKDGRLALHSALNRKLGNGKFVTHNMNANQAVRIQSTDNLQLVH